MTKYILKSTQETPQFKIDYRSELNDEQYQVVTQGDGPCLVLAGAGSGKTRTLVYRVAYLLERGVPADRILLMTFTNKAAKEMLNRIEVLLKAEPKGMWGGTFHHIGNRILRMYGKQIGIDPAFVILDQEDSRDLIKACLAELDVVRDKYFPKAEVIQKMISLAANLNVPVAEVIAERYAYIDEQIVPHLLRVATLYREKKELANTLDYDDLLVKWNGLLVAKPDLQQKLAQKFQYILVDEYQDTNPIQGELVKNLAGKNPNILAVGDDAQSIYSFRGATVENILQFPKTFPGAKTFRLETNYRSTPEILALANASIKHNTHQFKKTLHTTRPSSGKPVLAGLYNVDQQAEFIGQKILELQAEEGISLNDIAVLFRAHFHSLELEMELNKRAIPYEMRGGLRFFEQAHIKDVVAYLKAYANPKDELAWQRVLRMQNGVGDVNARRIWLAVSSASNLEQALAFPADGLPVKARAGWEEARQTFNRMLTTNPSDIADLIQIVLKNGYSAYALSNFENASDRVDDLKQLVHFAGSYDSLEKFLSDIALSEGFKGESITGYEEGPDEAVTLTTVHQAKGLEWKAVFVIGLAEGQFPHAKSYEDSAQLEEERRLFYVAVTRAQDQLFLTYPTIAGFGDIITRPSQFLRELPESSFERLVVEEEPVIQLGEDGQGGILDFYLEKKPKEPF